MAFAALFETALIRRGQPDLLLGGMGDDPDGVRTFALTHKPRTCWWPTRPGQACRRSAGAGTRRSPRGWVTPAQVALKVGDAATPPVPLVVAASDPLYLEQNLDIFHFSLTPEEMAQISAEKSCHAGSDHDHYPCLPYWPGGACNPCCCKAPPMHVGCCCANASQPV